MRFSILIIFLLILLLDGKIESWGTEYVYTPIPVEESSGKSAEGVLVREVAIKRGDTLSMISKKYSGRGYYYPQILLFNQIRNPNRIYPGQIIRIPVSGKKPLVKTQDSAKTELPTVNKPSIQPVTIQPVAPKPVTVKSKDNVVKKNVTNVKIQSREETHYYKIAVAAFKKGECARAIKLLDDFINRYPSSRLLPEATLNRAECYMKMSVN